MTSPAESSLRPAIIGIAGGSASGKTTVVDAVVHDLGPNLVSVIQHDSYYHDRSHVPPQERVSINYDHPNSLETSLLVQHLTTLLAGQSVEVPVYDFTHHKRTSETVTAEPRKAVIVEGILILADRDLREMMDIKVFVDADSDLRIIRRMYRDISERGRTLDTVVRQYLQTVRPMHLEFVEPSKRYADIIIPGGGQNKVAVGMLIAKIHTIVQAGDTRREVQPPGGAA